MKLDRQYKIIRVFTDGGSRGNPGPSAIGIYITDEENNRIFAVGKSIGIATNNIAEYKAVLEAHKWIVENKENIDKDAKIFFNLDSELVYCQLKGIYKIKNSKLKEILIQIQHIKSGLSFNIIYAHVPREQNKQADRLVNEALDNPPLVTYN